jgi:N-acetylmuramoyl-L-alanine amidase CwlA
MVKIRQNLLSEELYSWKSPNVMKPTRIVVHNTANDASADAEIKYMNKSKAQGGVQTSFHYAVDDKEAVQGLPENRNGWHAGDGGNGKGNREGIAIEICYSKSGGIKFNNAEKRAAKEIAALLKQYGWTINNVKKHQDFSNKYCPHRTLDNGWKRFLTMIEVELSNLNKPANTVKYRVVTGSFSSLENANARVKS